MSEVAIGAPINVPAIASASPRCKRKWRAAGIVGLGAMLLLVSGCRHRTPVAQLPPQSLPPARIPVTHTPRHGIDAADLRYIATHRPIATQTGYATWYTAPRGRKAADGEVFRNDALTAAHRTLPMGSLILVTNLETGQSSAMRITDRGPFVAGRILDMTIASARATGIYRAGRARVRIDVYEAPQPIFTGGRWCVQIGAFHNQRAALRMKARLRRAYPRADVIEFPGERSYWVRIRPPDDDRRLAETIARDVHPSEGDSFLTRLN